MQEQIVQTVHQAQTGSRKVRVTFKKEVSLNDILSLIAMCSGNRISMSHDDESVLRICALQCGWENDDQRTMDIAFADDFNEKRFIEIMQRTIENIEVVN